MRLLPGCEKSPHLVDEADGGGLTAVEEVHVDDLQLLQADVEGLELAVVPIQRDDLEEAVVEPQANHAALWVHDTDDACLGGPSYTVLGGGRAPCQISHNWMLF